MILLNKGTNKVVEELGIFPDEADLHILVEHNIQPLFGLELIKSEFTIQGKDSYYKIDSLCYDLKNNNFVIIEYKREKDKLLINQVDNYRRLLVKGNNYQKNQQECAERLFERMQELDDAFYKKHEKQPLKGVSTLRDKEIKWNNTKIIFVARSFDNTQKDYAADHDWELWEYKRFSNSTIIFYSPTQGEKLISEETALSTAAPHKEKGADTANTLDKDLAKMSEDIRRKWKELEDFCNKSGFEILQKKGYYSLVSEYGHICYLGFPSRKKRIDLTCYRGIERDDGSRHKNFFTAGKNLEEKLKLVGSWEKRMYQLSIEENSDESALNNVISLIKQKDDHLRQKYTKR